MKERTLILLSGILAFALGVALLMLAFGRGGADEMSGEGNAELVAELRELQRSQERTAASIEALVHALSRQLPAPTREPSARESLGGAAAPPSFDVLVASLDALRASLEAESRLTRELIRTTPGLGGESLVEARERNSETRWDALVKLEREWRADTDQANRSQYFLTTQELLEAYGPPTEIFRPRGGMLFYYRRHAKGTSGPAWYFRLQDGIVVEFFLEDEHAGEE